MSMYALIMYALISNAQKTRFQGKASKAWHPVIMVKKRAIFSCHRSISLWIHILHF